MTCSPDIPVRDGIADRALAQVGRPFRFKGRTPTGFDCVGLVAHAAALGTVPYDYSLRGSYLGTISAHLAAGGFLLVDGDGARPGDILIVEAAPAQWHLLIAVRGGCVHAHAGLDRVVFTPGPPPWPVKQCWRRKED